MKVAYYTQIKKGSPPTPFQMNMRMRRQSPPSSIFGLHHPRMGDYEFGAVINTKAPVEGQYLYMQL